MTGFVRKAMAHKEALRAYVEQVATRLGLQPAKRIGRGSDAAHRSGMIVRLPDDG
ncbi:hypothetical protein ACTMU2_15070 [Cupriavidus basilensis]